MRAERWRYTESGADGVAGAELYVEQIDPGGHMNLGNDPAHTATLARMKKRLHELLSTRASPARRLRVPSVSNPMRGLLASSASVSINCLIASKTAAKF